MAIGFVTTSSVVDGRPVQWSLKPSEALLISYTFSNFIDISNESFEITVIKEATVETYPMIKSDQTIHCIIPSADTVNWEVGDRLLEVWNIMPDLNRQILLQGDIHVR